MSDQSQVFLFTDYFVKFQVPVPRLSVQVEDASKGPTPRMLLLDVFVSPSTTIDEVNQET